MGDTDEAGVGLPPLRQAAGRVSGIRLASQVSGAAPVVLPTLALGTGGYNDSVAEQAVLGAFRAGFRAVHTAFDYYNVRGVGDALRKIPRRDVFVIAMTSPCIHSASNPRRNVSNPSECTDLTKKEVRDMLNMLGVDYVDLLLLHGPSEPFNYTGACDALVNSLNKAQWEAYKFFLDRGQAKSIGCSNFCPSCLEGLSDPIPSVNQVQWHVGMGSDPEGLMSYCRERGIVVQAYSPLAGGEVVKDPLCVSVGSKYGKSAAQVGLRWVVQHNGTAAVVKSASAKYQKEDIQVMDWRLHPLDMASLAAATTPHGQNGGRPSWGCAK